MSHRVIGWVITLAVAAGILGIGFGILKLIEDEVDARVGSIRPFIPSFPVLPPT